LPEPWGEGIHLQMVMLDSDDDEREKSHNTSAAWLGGADP